MVKSQKDNLLLSQYGAHLVCAQFAKRGKIAELVFQNAPKIDALVYDPDSEKTIPIQIKTSRRDSFRTFSGTKKELIEGFKANLWFVFVYVNEIDRFFIVPGDVVKKLKVLKTMRNMWLNLIPVQNLQQSRWIRVKAFTEYQWKI